MNDTALLVLFGMVVGLILIGTIINTVLIVLLFQDKKNENGRLANIEEYLKELSEEVESQVVDSPSTGRAMFHSVDGKYHAQSLPDLLKQMMQDPDTNIPKDIDTSDPEVIRQFLKDINSELPYDEDEDEGEEDDPSDNWKNGKK